MTTEVQEYKCPSCGHILGQEEYLHACKKLQENLTKELQRRDDQHAKQMQREKERHAEELQMQGEKFALEVESVVRNRVSAELTEMDNKHMQELARQQSKHNQEMKATWTQAVNFATDKARQENSEREERHRQTVEQYELQIKRMAEDNKRMAEDNKKAQITIEEQRKTIEKIPPELGGTAGENVLLDDLKKEFSPPDEFNCKKNGIAMADIIQTIVTEKGVKIPTPIVYDKKTSRKVNNSDLDKAKNYKRIHKTDYCIIVTNDIAKENRFTEVRDGVLLVRPRAVVDIASRIRSFLIENSKHEKENNGREAKKDKLYEFFTSSEYNRDVQRRIDVRSKLDELQLDEEKKHRNWWNKRRELFREWDDLDSKLDGFVSHITQGDENEEDNDEDDGESPSS